MIGNNAVSGQPQAASRKPQAANVLWLVLGLGNPLPEFATTRHNVGHRVVEELAQRAKSRLRRRGKALAATCSLGGVRCVLAKSLTYMNESGRAAQALIEQFGITPTPSAALRTGQLLVVCDDINLPLGRLRLRRSGSDGGQKGLRSVIEVLGTREFPRLRVGVGTLPPGEDAVAYVLSPFGEEEQEAVGDALKRAANCLEMVILNGLGAAMNRFNPHPSTGQTPATEAP